MRTFIVYGSTAHGDGRFNISDMPGSGGRIDVLARCVTASFVLSDAIRRDVMLYLVIAGKGESKVVRLDGSQLRNLNPDERSTGALLRHTLLKKATDDWSSTGPGVSLRLGGIGEVLEDAGSANLVLLSMKGAPVESLPSQPIIVIGDHKGLPMDIESAVLGKGASVVSIGPKEYHSDHCISYVNLVLDKTEHASSL